VESGRWVEELRESVTMAIVLFRYLAVARNTTVMRGPRRSEERRRFARL
jgi:hypothetical protein